MLLLLLASLVILLWGIRPAKLDWGGGGLPRQQTQAVNGFFTLFIMLSHFRIFLDSLGYSFFDEPGGKLAMYFFVAIGQLCVVPFLFFSGYGVMERIKQSGQEYVVNLTKCRILPFYINSLPVAIAWVFLGFIIGGVSYPSDAIAQILFWRGIDFGPCWYNLCIVLMYLFTYLAFKGKSACGNAVQEIVVWVLSVAYALAMSFVRPGETWWYNTIWAYPMGVSYSRHKQLMHNLVQGLVGWLMLAVALISIVIGHRFSVLCAGIFYNLYSIPFVLVLLVVMHKLDFGNPVLRWIGSRVFQIYMWHLFFYRLTSLIIPDPTTFLGAYSIFVVSLAMTGLMAWLYPKFSCKILA